MVKIMDNNCICRYCRKKINKESAYSIVKGQYYCNEEHYLSHIDKKNNNTKHSFKSPKGTERRAYTDAILNLYLQQGFDKKFPRWQILMSQTSTILKNNPSWTYDTILYILWYEQEILGLNLICEESHWSPLSLIEYYALEAEEYYNECSEIAKSVENYNFDDCNIVVKSSKSNKIKYKPLTFDTE